MLIMENSAVANFVRTSSHALQYVTDEKDDDADARPWKPEISGTLWQLQCGEQRFSLFLQSYRRKSDIQHCGFSAKINLGEIVLF